MITHFRNEYLKIKLSPLLGSVKKIIKIIPAAWLHVFSNAYCPENGWSLNAYLKYSMQKKKTGYDNK